MAWANYTDFKVSYYTGSVWSDTYNATTFTSISDMSSFPSGTSKLQQISNVGDATLNRVGGQLVEVDSGGFWLGFTFDLIAKNTAGDNVLRGLLDKTQAKNATFPYFRIYPDVVNNATDYYDCHFKSFEWLYLIENGVRGGRFTFMVKAKATTFTTF